MSNLSLQKSIRTCKVNTGESDRIESDRFLNSANLLCPTWTGFDLAGRRVCADSFWTKSPGCNSSTDRITVENDLRPNYVEYITLNAAGIEGNMYGSNPVNQQQTAFSNDLLALNNVTGNFGKDFMANVRNYSCSMSPYDSMVDAQNKANATAMYNTYFATRARSAAGI